MSETTTVTAALEKIRERYRKSFTTLPGFSTSPDTPWAHVNSADDVPLLLAAIEAALKHHAEAVVEDMPEPHFRYCRTCSGHPAWPCPEVADITSALLAAAQDSTREESQR